MPIMQSVMGMGGNQPSSSPDPTAPPGSAAGQTQAASIPAPSAQPQQQASNQNPFAASAPSDAQAAPPSAPEMPGKQTDVMGLSTKQAQTNTEDQDVDDLIASLANDRKDKRIDKALKVSEDNKDTEVDNLLNGITGVKAKPSGPEGLFGPRKEGEGNWEYFSRNLPQGVKYLGAQMRSHLGRDPVEQRQAFESMYGPDNVKVSGGSLMFRPDPNSSFKKVDQTLFNGIVDFALYNSLNAIPMAANAVATGAASIGATGASGNPAVGLGAGLLAGGTAEAVTRNALIVGLNTVSSQPQSSKNIELKNEILKDAGFNLAAGTAGAMLTKIPIVKQALNKFSDAFISAEEKILSSAGEKISKLANVKASLQEFHDLFFPNAPVANAVGAEVNTAIENSQKQMASTIGAIKSEALSLSSKAGTSAQMDNTLGKLDEILTKNGFEADDFGMMKRNPNVDTTLSSGPYQKSLDTLASYNNRLKAESVGDGGTKLQNLFQDLDNLAGQAKYDMTNPQNSDVRNMFRVIRNAASSDRDAYMGQLFSQADSPAAQTYKNAYSNYSSKIDSIGDFKAMFHSDADREMMVNTLSKAPTPDKVEMLDNIKNILGPDAPEWNGLRGGIVSNILNQRTKEGVLNAQDALKFINSPGNKALIDRVLLPDEKPILNKMLIEASKLDTTGVFTGGTATAAENGVAKLMNMATSAKDGLMEVFKIFGNDKKAIDYLTDEGFLNIAQQMRGPAAREKILEAMRMSDAARSKMQIVNIPTESAKAANKFRQVYVPVLGAGGTAYLEKIFNPQRPQNAGPTQPPAQQPPPQP